MKWRALKGVRSPLPAGLGGRATETDGVRLQARCPVEASRAGQRCIPIPVAVAAPRFSRGCRGPDPRGATRYARADSGKVYMLVGAGTISPFRSEMKVSAIDTVHGHERRRAGGDSPGDRQADSHSGDTGVDGSRRGTSRSPESAAGLAAMHREISTTGDRGACGLARARHTWRAGRQPPAPSRRGRLKRLYGGQGDLFQRRGHSAAAPAVRTHRRRHRRLLPQVGCHRRRVCSPRRMPGDRPEPRQEHQGFIDRLNRIITSRSKDKQEGGTCM
jgi:hypothetical protein